jgi:aminoglycoside phosphotransferase (APT) family kinase protein
MADVIAGLDHERLARQVLDAAGLRQPDELVRAPEGVGNHVYLAGDVVVRLGTGSDAPVFPRAIAVLRAARGRVKVPEVIFSDCSQTHFPVPAMVLARVRGEPLSRTWPSMSADDRWRMVEAVAAELAALHTLGPDDVPDAGFASPWWGARVEKIERLMARLRPTAPIPAAWFEVMERHVADNASALVDAPAPCILHNDVNRENVLVAGGEVTALLDFDDAIAEPPEGDAWGLLFAADLHVDPWTELRRLRELPGFDLSVPGVLERFRMAEVENILDLLTGELSWTSPEAAVEDARETYLETFASDGLERLMEQLR